MDTVTYPHDRVVSFLQENDFVLVKLDVSNEDAASVARQFRITGVPAQIVVRGDGEEVGRNIGYLSPADLIEEAEAWLEDFRG